MVCFPFFSIELLCLMPAAVGVFLLQNHFSMLPKLGRIFLSKSSLSPCLSFFIARTSQREEGGYSQQDQGHWKDGSSLFRVEVCLKTLLSVRLALTFAFSSFTLQRGVRVCAATERPDTHWRSALGSSFRRQGIAQQR